MPLTSEEVIQCVEAIPGLFRSGMRLIADEIGDGNMDFVFRVAEHGRLGSQCVIVKQAPGGH